MGLRWLDGGRRDSSRLCVVVIIAAVVGANVSGESGCRSGRTTGSSGTNTSTGVRAIDRGRRRSHACVRAARRGCINEGGILELADTVADDLARGTGLLKLRRDGFSGGVCNSEAGGPKSCGRGGGGELVEVDLAVWLDIETGVRVGVVRGAGAVDGANSCEGLGVSGRMIH